MVSLPSSSDDEAERADEYYREIYCTEGALVPVKFFLFFMFVRLRIFILFRSAEHECSNEEK